MSAFGSEKKRSQKTIQKKEEALFTQLENLNEEESEPFLDESGTTYPLNKSNNFHN